MRILVFDTETTGFIDKKETDLTKQPSVIQFAWIIWKLENKIFKEEKRINILINPWKPIPFRSSQVNHIYDIDVKWKPEFYEISHEIISAINSVDAIVWHNIEYDEDMIKLELKRLGIDYEYRPKQVICTMNSTINYCKLPKKNDLSKWYKRPKLWELHKVLFKEYFIWAHDAIVDVEATLKCFVELANNDIIKVEKKQENIMSLF